MESHGSCASLGQQTQREGLANSRQQLEKVSEVRSADLQHSGGFHHGRFALALGKFGSLRAIGIDPGKALAVLVEDGDLPVLVLAALVLAEFGMLAYGFHFCHGDDYLNRARRAQVPVRALCSDKTR